MKSEPGKALKAAFPHTLPILAGFLFLGMAYGILVHSKGFAWPWTLLMSSTIFAGSMEFVAVGLLAGWKKFFLIFGMCDETFSINCSVEPPEGVDKGWFQLFITILNYLYWVGGALLGSIAGAFLPFDTTGIDFAMTALFVVVYLNQWMEAKDHRPALIGLGATLLCLIVFGADNFILPAMALILLSLTLLRKKLEPAPKGGKKA